MKLEMRYFYLNGNYDHEKTQCLNDTFFIQSFEPKRFMKLKFDINKKLLYVPF